MDVGESGWWHGRVQPRGSSWLDDSITWRVWASKGVPLPPLLSGDHSPHLDFFALVHSFTRSKWRHKPSFLLLFHPSVISSERKENGKRGGERQLSTVSSFCIHAVKRSRGQPVYLRTSSFLLTPNPRLDTVTGVRARIPLLKIITTRAN